MKAYFTKDQPHRERFNEVWAVARMGVDTLGFRRR